MAAPTTPELLARLYRAFRQRVPAHERTPEEAALLTQVEVRMMCVLPPEVEAALETVEHFAEGWERLVNPTLEAADAAAANAEAVRRLTGWVRQQAGVPRG